MKKFELILNFKLCLIYLINLGISNCNAQVDNNLKSNRIDIVTYNIVTVSWNDSIFSLDSIVKNFNILIDQHRYSDYEFLNANIKIGVQRDLDEVIAEMNNSDSLEITVLISNFFNGYDDPIIDSRGTIQLTKNISNAIISYISEKHNLATINVNCIIYHEWRCTGKDPIIGFKWF